MDKKMKIVKVTEDKVVLEMTILDMAYLSSIISAVNQQYHSIDPEMLDTPKSKVHELSSDFSKLFITTCQKERELKKLNDER